MVSKYICLFLIPMSICTLLVLLEFCRFESSLIAFFLNFNSSPSIHSFLLCERYFDFNSRTKKKFGNLIHTDVVQHVFWYIFASWDILTLIILLALDCGMGSFKYNTLFTLLPFHGSFFVKPLGQSLVWNEWSLKIVFYTFLSLIIYMD